MKQTTFIGRKTELQRLDEFLKKAALEEARLAAEFLGSRWLMWQILAPLAEVEPDKGKSSALKSQAGESIQFIADHIHDDEMRSQFLKTERVSVLIA